MLTLTQIDLSYHKVITTIESCKTRDQLKSASKMVKNFKNLYEQIGYPKVFSYNLDNKLNKQLWQVLE